MYNVFLILHDTFRWLLLISLILTLTKYLNGWLGKKPWKKIDKILGIVFTSLMDLQLLVGLILYFFLSPLTRFAFSDFGTAMKESNLRFYAVEHISIMLIAAVIVHIGQSKSKKAKTDVIRFKILSIYLIVALTLIVIAIPWTRLVNN